MPDPFDMPDIPPFLDRRKKPAAPVDEWQDWPGIGWPDTPAPLLDKCAGEGEA